MGLTVESDETLVRLFQQTSDTRYLDALFTRYMGKICGMVRQIVLDGEDAEDVTQEVFIRAARALHRFKGDSRFSTWLYRIAINTSRTFLKKAARRRKVLSTTGELDQQAVSPGPTPDHALRGIELNDHLTEAMRELPPRLRTAVVLVIIEELSPREAARIEGVSTATMYWRIHTARQQLKTALESYYEGRRS